MVSVRPAPEPDGPLFCLDCYTKAYVPDFEEDFELA